MRALFAFQGTLRPLPYAGLAAAVFLSQHAVAYAALARVGRPVGDPWLFALVPLRSVAVYNEVSSPILLAALAWMLLAAWALAALSFRRAADAAAPGLISAFAVAPILQAFAIIALAVTPSRAGAQAGPAAHAPPDAERRRRAAALGVLAGLALTLFSVATGALVFGTYGDGMFIVAPFAIGALTAYVANAAGDIGPGATFRLVALTTVLGGMGLVAIALEGMVCIVLAAPLGIAIAWLGGLLGRAVALSRSASPGQPLSLVVLLPLVFAAESALPSVTPFETRQEIDVAAPPAAVWRALVDMDPIAEPPALPFRLGMAYPIGAEILGEGVGAERRGAFSTGVARERVTAWEPGRKLAFTVVEDVPAMRELSPYETVHAPHVDGYFRTIDTSFELVGLGPRRTRIVERTTHALRLDPAPYWLVMARIVVAWNNARVLRHVRAQAEGARP